VTRAATALCLIIVAGAAGCIVTDELGFEDLVNNPPEVVSITPTNSMVEWVCKDVYDYTVTVWDPDEDDAASYDGKIYLSPNPDDATITSELGQCGTTPITESEEDHLEYETGVLVSVNCSLNLKYLGGVDENDIMLARIIISDRRFVKQTIPDDARTAEVFWTLRLSPDEYCE